MLAASLQWNLPILTGVHKEYMSQLTDQEILERFYSDRDNSWLGILLQRYTLLLFGVCMKYLKNEEEAKDAVQQIFLKTISELHKYKVEYFKSWIYMVAKNYCLMKLRERQGKTPLSIQEDLMMNSNDQNEMTSDLEKDQLLQFMSSALDELNQEQKLCVTLFYLKKKSYQEIAYDTGFSLMQVKSHIQNGKRNLKIELNRRIKLKS
jgi:RNA polymerase sigma-70 factor (ECF subfamily)